MENFYKITKAEADLMGRFEYATNQAIDPYCSEQTDGTFIISEKMYELLKGHPNLQKINFSKKRLIEKDNLQTKPQPL